MRNSRLNHLILLYVFQKKLSDWYSQENRQVPGYERLLWSMINTTSSKAKEILMSGTCEAIDKG